MDPIVTAACDLLAEGRAFVLATIISHEGSTPRTSGTRMLITKAQEIVGTIGGGLLELETMQVAAQMDEQAPARILDFDLANRDAANLGMICGGVARVLLDYIRPDEDNRRLFGSWLEEISQGRKAMLISQVSGPPTESRKIDHALLKSDHSLLGGLDLPADVREMLSERITQAAVVQVLDREGDLIVADPGHFAQTLYVFGAGHVAVPTAHLAAMVGFDVVVLDDRSEFAAAARFPDAAAVHTIASFDTAFDSLNVSADDYVIIVTRGHLHDRTVLAQALKTPAAYIGMIGSRKKRDAVYMRLLKDGYTAADIARVHSPIGLSIGADTPEEIAVSIVGEMIAVRAGLNK
jgi:xanthine dehydrogenase accessory factor